MQPEQPVDYDKPVAYDLQGRPLYLRPAAVVQPVVPVVQPIEVKLPDTPPAADAQAQTTLTHRHDESMKRFPGINISHDEYVISEVTRHTIGMIVPAVIATVLGLIIVIVLSLYSKFVPTGNPSFSSLLLPAVLLIGLIVLGTYIIIWTYKMNRFFVTNESIIQQVQTTLFAHDEKTVDLAEVKDISYAQSGIVQTILDYGSIKITTEGGDETYTFSSVAQPKKVVTMLNMVLEDFKNGRSMSATPIVDLPNYSGSF